MDQFFHNINRRLNDIAKKQTVTESVVAEKITPPIKTDPAERGKYAGKNIADLKAAKAANLKKTAGYRERGEPVPQAAKEKTAELNFAIRAKQAHGGKWGKIKEQETDESALQAYLGKKKYGEEGMKALQKAGREHVGKEKMAKIRAKYDKMDEEMADEGNAFTAKLKATPKGGEFELGGKKFKDTSNLEEKKAKPDYLDLDKDGNKKETMKKAAKDAKKSRSSGTAFDPEVAKTMFSGEKGKTRTGHEVKDTGYSKRYTKPLADEPEADDEKSDAPKKKGRPAGTKRAIGAKGPTGKSKLLKKDAIKETDMEEDLDTDGVMMTRPSNMSSEGIESIALVDKGEYDREGEMAKQQIHTIMRAAKSLHKMLGDDENLPEWVQKKITLAQNYIDGVADYMASVRAEQGTEEPIAEKAVSQQQQKFMGMVHAMQKGEKIPGASKELKKAAKEMPKKAAKEYAATKHAGLPKKVKSKEETDEAAMSGAEVKDVKNPAPKGKGGMQFGKGIYESMDKKFKQALTEGMNISVNMSTGPDGEPTKNITVSAEGEDAEALAALLKMAGMGQKQEVCPGCGSADCGCEDELDENSPDWPTNKEKIDADPNLRTYSGGLNGPKSTGQTTVPVIASQLRRQVSMDESVELERSLFKLYQNYKAQ